MYDDKAVFGLDDYKRRLEKKQSVISSYRTGSHDKSPVVFRTPVSSPKKQLDTFLTKSARVSSKNIKDMQSEIILPKIDETIDYDKNVSKDNKVAISYRRGSKVNKSLMELYHHNEEFYNKLYDHKNSKKLEIDESLKDYQSKIIDLMKGKICNQNLNNLTLKFKKVNQNLDRKPMRSIMKHKSNMWEDLSKKVKHIVPEYLSDKFSAMCKKK